ncbi:P-loop NTPase fold protein [Paraburkholderia xenovorans]|uniref:KAP family P-loop NTPase fold protein n=1 Tax=Paraburkholderia xenovorans TaxID=36873 RepID=UPI0038BD8CD3
MHQLAITLNSCTEIRLDNFILPLATKRWHFDPESAPFEDDLLERVQLAEKLTGFVERLHVGSVLAIDAPWGQGKSWFGHNWAAKLKKEDHKVVFINAFEQDYIEDPFMLIAAELANLLDDNKGIGGQLREKAAAVMRALLPLGTKALINVAGRFALGAMDLSEDLAKMVEAAKDGAVETSEKWVERKLEDHEQEKASLEGYQTALGEFASKEAKPMVVFIDELDRCNPAFAVRLIERIKHFFEIGNLVFVLLMNRSQLQSAIKGVYGADTDAAAYLGKFVHLFFRLPNQAASRFVPNTLLRYGFDVSNPNTDPTVKKFLGHLCPWVDRAKLSLRDVDRACALFALAHDKDSAGLLAYLITLKIKQPDLFESLLVNSVEADKNCIAWINKFRVAEKSPQLASKLRESPNWYFQCLTELHALRQSYATGSPSIATNLDLEPSSILGEGANRHRHRAIEMVLRQIDLSLDVSDS